MDDWDDWIDSMHRAPRVVAKQTHFAFIPDEPPQKDAPSIDATLALLAATPLTIPEVAARRGITRIAAYYTVMALASRGEIVAAGRRRKAPVWTIKPASG